MSDSGETVDRRGTPPGEGTVLPEHGGRIGNPPHVPNEETRRTVYLYAKIADQGTISAALGVSVDTLQRHYREELDKGQAEAILLVGGKLLDKAIKGDGPSQRFYLATRGKGSYSRKIEVDTNPGGGSESTEQATQELIEMLTDLAAEKKLRSATAAAVDDQLHAPEEEGGEGEER